LVAGAVDLGADEIGKLAECSARAAGDGFCTFCEPAGSTLDTSAAKQLLHVTSEISTSPDNTRRMM